MSEIETCSSIPAEGSRPASFAHVYNGKFKDLNQDLRAAGILTYAPGENVDKALRHSAPSQLTPVVEKYRSYFSPNLAETRFHYGHFNDPRDYEKISHGVRTDDRSYIAKHAVNPKSTTRFEALKNNLDERIYKSNKTAPLGRVPFLNLPKHVDPLANIFGRPLVYDNNAKECINPDKTRAVVEAESSDKHDYYVFSHGHYEPGEQKDRQFARPFDKDVRFGVTTNAFHDGRMTKESVAWLPQTLLERRNQCDSKLLDDFREKHIPQVGKPLDPNRETRFIGPDHVFGLTNTMEQYGAADIIHGRDPHKTLKGKDRERAFLASLRSHLANFNYTKFKTLVDAFKFYDKDKDGLISKEEMRFACAATGYPAAEDLLNMAMNYCDQAQVGGVNFLEFSNFLCFKDSMKTGLNLDKNSLESVEIRDDEGRFLLRGRDLVHKNHLEVNELVPRNITSQIDEKIGNWKTTYDILNEAPTRLEPLKKRVYGVPSIRNDLVAPNLKKIQDKINYGNDGNVWSLVSPTVFAQHGIYERDILKPRSKDEIRTIFTNIGHDFDAEGFEKIWSFAQEQNARGEVSVEEFRSALKRFISHSAQNKTTLVCA